MTRVFKNRLRRFLQEDSGATYTIEFVLWVPLFLILIIATIEMGAMSMRHTQLERSLDSTVRMVRLGTGDNFSHDTLKTNICSGAPLLAACEATLQLEMVPLDLRNWSNPPNSADCVDTAAPVNPLRMFQNGQNNELMYLRACYKYRPIAPTGALAGTLYTDDEGYTQIVSFAAFVQEPSS